MIKTEFAEKMVTKRIETMRFLFCDRCHKLIYKRYSDEYNSEFGLTPKHTQEVEWFNVTTGHYDWGNDSCESIEHHEYCCECLPKAFEVYVSRANGTDYFEVHHDYWRSLPLEEG